MPRLRDDIARFIEDNGFHLSYQMRHDMDIIAVTMPDGSERLVMPLEIKAESLEEAAGQSSFVTECIERTRVLEELIIITEDRWRRNRAMMESRLLAHLGTFSQIYARNCEVRKIDKAVAQAFLKDTHSYGYAACRHRYGLFLKRHTGHNLTGGRISEDLTPGRLVAVATFSNARRWVKGDKEIRSYEWTRYASLPQVRINGGMGKMLRTFIEDVRPDDIMSYADLEWSTGSVYGSLGFRLESHKAPVTFRIDTSDWSRNAVPSGDYATSGSPTPPAGGTDTLYFRNFGSNKYRLKLTDYQ